MADETTCDVLVIGFGGAGASAAIEAHDAGAEVVILEKLDEPGGNTRWSNCSWFSPPPGTEKMAVEHIDALCFGRTPIPVIEAYVKMAGQTKAWLEGFGATAKTTHFLNVRYPTITHPSWPNFPGSAAMVNQTVMSPRDDQPNGERLFQLLAEQVNKRGIKAITGAPAKDLITNEAGEVVGATYTKAGQTHTIKARRSVILTTGGFEFNEEMKDEYLPIYPVTAIGSPGNTGDGITMARKLGAQIWHMGVCVAGFGLEVEGYPGGFGISFPTPHFIHVNKYGKRFANELGSEMHFAWHGVATFDPKKPGHPTLPSYAIFGEEAFKKGAVSIGTAGTTRHYKWSADNSAELAKGWIKKADSIADLAKILQLDPAALEKTVTKYNEACASGVDGDFHRSKDTMQPIKGPFYAMEMHLRMVNTMGGPRRDENARIVKRDGTPIGRLYSAGELGSLWGHLYCGGGNVGEALAIGRQAGQNAAKEKPWSN